MKTAISIDEGVYTEAEDTARELGLSRSKLYSLAIEEYIQNHKPDMVMERLNEVYGKSNPEMDNDLKNTQLDLLSRAEW
jgi:metal-responsive CopG/Arc/MetJ family transcriptional regulator